MVEYAPKGLIGVLTPQANTTVEPELAILWPRGVAMINARLTSAKTTIEEFDSIMGLFHDGFPTSRAEIPAEIKAMLDDRQKARKDKDFQRADELRDAIVAAGYVIEDTPSGPRVRKK